MIVARIDLAKAKGCDGIDFDSVDAYSSKSGFPLTAETQIDFNRFLAKAAHDRGMLAGLNNTPGIAIDLVHDYDFAISEQCFENSECGGYHAFTAQGKAVLNAEYTAYSAADCSRAKAAGISLVYFSSALNGSKYQACEAF